MKGIDNVGKLQGLAKIELTNVRTGVKTVQYEKNMITNAIANILKNNPFGANSYSSSPIKMMSGVMLFNDNITENVNNVYIPQTPSAWAGSNTNTGAGTRRGSMNLASSVITSSGAKLVWEWNTSQGNGTYKCIALTHPSICSSDIFGQAKNETSSLIFGEQLKTSIEVTESGAVTEATHPGLITWLRPHYVDTANGYFYRVKSTDNGLTLTIRRIKRAAYNIPVTQSNTCPDYKYTDDLDDNASASLYKDYREATVNLGTTITNGTSLTTVSSMHFVGNMLYIYTVTDNTNTVMITTIDLSTFSESGMTATQVTKSFNSIKFGINTVYGNIVYKVAPELLCIKDDYLYIPKYEDRTTMYAVNVEDPTDITSVTNDGTVPYIALEYPGLMMGNFFVCDKYILDTTLNKITPFAGSIGAFQRDMPKLMVGDNYYMQGSWHGYAEGYAVLSQQLYAHPFYIATINNVTPFQKTAEQAMKITYTITEV